uniref:peptidoglycan-binding domain-containing protein n=1 Tax=Streptomyces scabiei TaxID=1930 RepID=UPI000A961AEA
NDANLLAVLGEEVWPGLIGAAGLTACLAAAGVVLTLLSPSTTEASPRKGTTDSADARPGDSVSLPASKSADRAGAAPDGGSGASEVSGKEKEERAAGDDDTPRPGASASGSGSGKGAGSGSDDPSPTDPSVPDPSASESADPSPTPPDDPTEPGNPAWLTDCSYYYGNGVTRPGDSGDRVRQVQCMLSKRGYSLGPGGVSGEFDAGTKAAVQSFQRARQLVVKDGTVRPRVWRALRSTD